MPGIVCAIRGGPDSQPTITRAISLSKETNLPLYFLYVINLEFLTLTESSKTSIISEELEHVGEFILLAATEDAKIEHIHAEGIIRHGSVKDEIIKVAQNVQANYVILGLPQGVDEKNVFAIDHIQEFSKLIENESEAKVVFAERHNE